MNAAQWDPNTKKGSNEHLLNTDTQYANVQHSETERVCIHVHKCTIPSTQTNSFKRDAVPFLLAQREGPIHLQI